MSSTPRVTPYGYDQEFICVLNTSKDQITYYDTNGKVFIQENLAKDRFGRRYVKEQIEFGDTIIKNIGEYKYQTQHNKYKSFYPNGNPAIIGTKNHSDRFVGRYVEYWPNKEPKTVSFMDEFGGHIGNIFEFRRNGKIKSIDGPSGIVTKPDFSLVESFAKNFKDLFKRKKELDHYENSTEMLRNKYAYKQITAAMKIRHQYKQLIS